MSVQEEEHPPEDPSAEEQQQPQVTPGETPPATTPRLAKCAIASLGAVLLFILGCVGLLVVQASGWNWENADFSELGVRKTLLILIFLTLSVLILACVVLGRIPKWIDKLTRGSLERELAKLQASRQLQIGTIAVSLAVLAFFSFLTWIIIEHESS